MYEEKKIAMGMTLIDRINYSQLIKKELEYLRTIKDKSIGIISMTARKSNGLRSLPRRAAMGFTAINFLVTEIEQARDCLLALDGQVEYILIDIEEKQNISLISEARRIVKTSKVMTCKPNDATIESCDLLIRHHYNDELEDRSVLVIGSGNLSTKIALRLAERQANVHLHSRSYQKTAQIAECLNLILPKFSKPIQAINKPEKKYNIIVSFLSAEEIIGEGYLPLLDEHSLVIDGGIHNFKSTFIKEALEKGITCYRLDVRIAFLYYLLLLSHEVESFFTHVMGRIEYQDKGYHLVSGGIIGRMGDIIVDKVMKPTQVVGIADGLGGVKSESRYSQEEKNKAVEILKKLGGHSG
ncbi:hypothetical protein [Sporolactobacillus putidus]|uniref:Quinate/shikimate 5-dehydrogenase/glutamyl-tRNA reductase domain-containing protein n=1 Tax=Sporolactobacillus putidus TaxID=492735 RepID=A0A917S0H1_9BACL|nr:hypothetical protein [Sporolactobacillus putidus]GGL48881.1 hypothetical protein GCM10007968_11290 [Sporolactobacillus putidus]